MSRLVVEHRPKDRGSDALDRLIMMHLPSCWAPSVASSDSTRPMLVRFPGHGAGRPLALTMLERGGPALMKRIKTHSDEEIEDATRPPTDGLAAYEQVAAVEGHRHLG